MTVPAAPVRRLYRRPDHALVRGLGGVAAGIGEHLHIRPRIVRVAFVVLAAAGGLGVALYGAYWIVLPTPPGTRPSRMPPWLEYTFAAIAAAAVVGVSVSNGPFGNVFVPTLLACLGGALIWRQATDPDRDRLLRLSRDSLQATNTGRLGRIRISVGGALVATGCVLVLAHSNLAGLRDALVAIVVAVVGLALVTGPWWMRMVAQLSAERSERIRSQERADIAAHLHDSVLQTLALIQRNAGSPREVARLARGQERELRTLLYGTRNASGQLAEELRKAAAEVEDAYAVSVDVVVVGDAPLTDALAAAVAAAREALVNSAKHSGVDAISLYAEAEAQAVDIFVKDRGKGFDFATVADDRQGVRGSIIGRVERHGGHVTLRTSPGAGTEVQIRMDR